MSEIKLKPCPFCGSEKIDYSIKTTGRYERKYHMAMYCKECNCYGARVLITPTERNRYGVEHNEEYRNLAIEHWNTRKPMDDILAGIRIGNTEALKKYGIEIGGITE